MGWVTWLENLGFPPSSISICRSYPGAQSLEMGLSAIPPFASSSYLVTNLFLSEIFHNIWPFDRWWVPWPGGCCCSRTSHAGDKYRRACFNASSILFTSVDSKQIELFVEILIPKLFCTWHSTFSQPGGAPHSFVVTFLRSYQPFRYLVWSFGFSSTLLLIGREGERRFLKSRSSLASNSCEPYFKHTVKYLASDLPRRSSDGANPMMMITRVFKGFSSISWMVPTEMFCFYPAIHYVATFLRTSLQNPCCTLYYPPPRTFPPA